MLKQVAQNRKTYFAMAQRWINGATSLLLALQRAISRCIFLNVARHPDVNRAYPAGFRPVLCEEARELADFSTSTGRSVA
jgi:hypothetical protein